MPGIADIPILGKLVDGISDAAVAAIFCGFRYMFCYKDLVKTFESQVEKASMEEDRVSTKVAAERANGKLIQPHVDKWQKEAAKIKESTEKFAEKYKNRHSWRCIQCLPITNPVSRFRLGREAVKKTERLTDLIDSGKELLANDIAHPVRAENLPKSTTEFQEFQSRKDSYGELWHALTTDSSPIVGIYGMPGVGKTRMMEQLWEEAAEKKIFNKFARANVGKEELNVIHLQKQIAEDLGCTFDSQDNAESRASQLKQSLLNAGKTLVILDDVWREIPLDFIGIPCSMGSKILLTSREKNVCLGNKCKTLVKITPLPNDEAWDQFKNIVGSDRIDSLKDESLAKKVCGKCGGLPLLIHVISKALQFETHNSWVDALEQLEKGEFVNIPDVEAQVYTCVKWSINKLHGDAMSCLFLCCLFNEDTDIPIKKLIRLATGSQLVSGESRVLSMVDTLRSSSLLLDCKEDECIKLHDIIRAVGRSIAFKDPKLAFSHVKCDVRLLDDAEFVKTKFLRLDLDGDNIHIPDDLVCPDLHSLWILCNNDIQQFSGGFFSMFENLRFLYVEGNNDSYLSKLKFSLQPLGKLRTLVFFRCDLTDINNTNVGLFPENLETLRLLFGHLPEPLDLSNLKYLRKLEIIGLRVKIMPNTISSLFRLEELHIPDGFEIWSDDSSAVAKPILVEINQLTHLKSLHIKFKISEPFQNTNIFDNLTLFKICVGESPQEGAHFSHKTSIELQGCHEESLKGLVQKAEYVKLKHIDINVIGSIFDSNPEAFTELRELHIKECNEMEHLARMSQDEIQHSPQTSFSKLTCLEITECSGLRYLFCNSVAKCLTQLQKLIIRDCPVMEAIVMNDGSSSGDIIHFSNLEELELSKVPRLRSFCSKNKDAMMQPSAQFQPLFHRMVEFPALKDLKIENVEDTSDIWERDYNSESSFCKLTTISLQGFSKLETIIPAVMLHKLSSLQSLRISDCSSLISGVGTDASNIDVCGLPALSHLYLNELPCLTETGLKSGNLYPNLKKLEINDCHSLTNVVPKDVMHLEEIIVRKCKKMKRIVGEAKQGEINDVLVFPELLCLRLELLPNLTSFCGEETDACKVEFPNVVTLEISGCKEIKLELIEFSDQLKNLDISCDKEIELPSTWQPRLHNLEILILRKCWSHDLKSLRFHRLKLLMVFEYSGCSALFTLSGFRSLQNLEALVISDCAFLEEIADDDQMSGMNKKTITLPRLQMVVLKNLPKLKSIIHGVNYGWLVPYLREVDVENCGLSNLFSFSELISLKTLKISRCAHLEEIVEDEVSGMNKKTITLSQLESVTLEDLPKLKSLIYSANHECLLLPNLSDVSVSNCGLSSLFMCSASRSLQSLTYLKVKDCRLLESIIKYARGDETSGSTEQIIFCLLELASVELRNLPDLRSFIHGANYDCYMPALWNMEVDNCGLSTAFTCSVFRNLQRLRFLSLSNCRMLEAIFEYASGDETSGTTEQIITLSKLESLRLRDLPALKSFIHGANYNCYMPALESLQLKTVDSLLFSRPLFSVISNDSDIWKYQIADC
ncbi:disease resistance protein At4g27190-like [Daucus carota subsp. sativus]|uniref:disease resistance protein At4g27190-like n=1 Tax=Daucus carota subsp. sativus TaxID=79200 RepID=UPI00308319EF